MKTCQALLAVCACAILPLHGADLVALGKDNGFEFTQEELETGWEELQESDEGLTDFELDVVSGGGNVRGGNRGC